MRATTQVVESIEQPNEGSWFVKPEFDGMTFLWSLRQHASALETLERLLDGEKDDVDADLMHGLIAILRLHVKHVDDLCAEFEANLTLRGGAQ